jgi:hypothetical protein
LGRHAVASGVESYIGFDERFLWLTGDPDRQFAPAMLSGVNVLLGGSDANTCVAKLQTEYHDIVDYYSTGTGVSSPNATLGFLAAYWNATHNVLHGSRTAKL